VIKIVFFGTPEYAVPIIDSLHRKFKTKKGESPIAGVVTQQPRPKGRKQILAYSPVDTWAHKHKIPIYYSCTDLIKNKVVADLGILVAYGEIVSQETISVFPHGILNIHPSLLPKYRGASPLAAAIAAREKITGGTIIKIDEKMDHGPIVCQFEEEILDDDNQSTLGNRIFAKSAEVLCQLFEPYLAGKIKLKKQDDEKATFTALVKKEDGFIPPEFLKNALTSALTRTVPVKKDWQIGFIKNYSLIPNAETLERFIRAMQPWPGALTEIKVISDKKQVTRRLKIIKAHLEKQPVTCHLLLVPDSVQLEGKMTVSWEEFKRGYPNFSF